MHNNVSVLLSNVTPTVKINLKKGEIILGKGVGFSQKGVDDKHTHAPDCELPRLWLDLPCPTSPLPPTTTSPILNPVVTIAADAACVGV